MPEVIASLYEITRQIDSGGGGIVYLGRHMRLGKDVVLKADKRPLSERAMTALRREAETLKNLNHAYIPQVYDFVIEDGIVYTVMDYIDGESFDKPLKRGERFSSREVVGWAKQVLEALVYLHGRPPYGILHSDIKPANIMLTEDGGIRLIDFNIALALGEDGAVSVGRSQGYASPEHYGMDYSFGDAARGSGQAPATKTTTSRDSDAETVIPPAPPMAETGVTPDGRAVSAVIDINMDMNGGPDKRYPYPSSAGGSKKTIVLDARSDIYGLGATLYHLLTGRRPALYAADVVPLSAADCGPGLAAIINKAMSPDKEQRFQTADEMLEAFVRIARNDPRSRRYRRFRAVTAAALAAMLAAGCLTAFTGLKRMEAEKGMFANAAASQNALERGDVSKALDLALLAAPGALGGGLFSPPAPAVSEKSLADALGVYDLADGFKPYRSVVLPSAPLMACLSPDGKTAAVVYAYETAVIDLESGRILFQFPMVQSALAEARFLNNSTLVCAGLDGLCAYDLTNGAKLWSGSPATAVAVSADSSAVAAINRDDTFATLYDAQGAVKAKVDFNGRKQRTAANDTFTNPRVNLLALSAEGRFLAVSFADGSLTVFDRQDPENEIDISGPSGFTRFEGGFSGDVLAFSGSGEQSSEFAAIDSANLKQLVSFDSQRPFGVVADESGIFVSSDNLVIKLNPENGGQKELAYADSDVNGFAVGGGYTLAALKGGCAFFDNKARLVSRHNRDYPTDITLISGDYAVVGGRDRPDMTVFKLERHEEAQIFSYDSAYKYNEARVSADGSRFTLFSWQGFRLYDKNGALLHEQQIPDAEHVRDQQYSKASGNLAVMYKDALRIYGGEDGAPVFEETGLRSVFYAPYGVSVLDSSGKLRLIDIDTGAEIWSKDTGSGQTFAAYCGMTVDSAFLKGRKLIGAAKTSDGGYRFAASDGTNGAVYDQDGRRLFAFPVPGEAEAFFTDAAAVISPAHGTPAVYSLKNGRRLAYLEKDAYLTYITQMGEHIVSQYISTDGDHFGILLNSAFQPVASLPRLCDISGNNLVFDYPQGVLRQSRVYSVDELRAEGRKKEEAKN